MERKMGVGNAVSTHSDDSGTTGDGRVRYPRSLRERAYSVIVKTVRRLRPDLELALCLEEPELWRSTGLEESVGCCNCVL